MTIDHSPDLDPREPYEGDLGTFHSLEKGDRVTFFEWPVEPLTVISREDDNQFGERVRVEAAGDESFLYEVDGNLWHYAEVDEEDSNTFPVQNLVLVDKKE